MQFREAPVLLDEAVLDPDGVSFCEAVEVVRLVVPERHADLTGLICYEETRDFALAIVLVELTHLKLPRDPAGDGDCTHPGVEVPDLGFASLFDEFDAEFVRDDVRSAFLADEAGELFELLLDAAPDLVLREAFLLFNLRDDVLDWDVNHGPRPPLLEGALPLI